MAAPAGASAGASASFEQAAVAMVRPPITASMEASLDFFMGQTPSSLSDTQNVPLHPAASGRQAKPGRLIPASGVRGDWASDRDRIDLVIRANGPTPSLVIIRRNRAIGYTRQRYFFGSRRGRVIRWATRRTTRPLADEAGGVFAGHARLSRSRAGREAIEQCDAVRPPRTRRATRSQRRARYGRYGSNSSR